MQLKIVNQCLATGIAGEFATNEPHRTRGFFLNSASGKDNLNIVGNAIFHSKTDDRVVGHFEDANRGDVAGLLGFPKSVVRKTLENVDFIHNSQQVEVIQQGFVFVKLWNIEDATKTNAQFSANIGDFIYYNSESGKLISVAPTTQMAKTKKWTRLYGATVAINNVAKPTANNYNVGIAYIDIAGDRTSIIEN